MSSLNDQIAVLIKNLHFQCLTEKINIPRN